MTNITKSLQFTLLCTTVAMLMTACGGGGGNDNPNKTGVLTDDPISGIQYTTSSGSSGTTNEFGQFNYKSGENITLTLAGQKITIPAADRITPSSIAQALADQAAKTATLTDDYSEQELQLAEAQLAYYFQNIDTDELPGIQSNLISQAQFVFPQLGLGKGSLLTKSSEEVAQSALLSALATYYGNEIQGVWTLVDVKTNNMDGYDISDQTNFGAKLYISQNIEGNSAVYTQYDLNNTINSAFKTAATAVNMTASVSGLIDSVSTLNTAAAENTSLVTSIEEYTPSESDNISKFDNNTTFSLKDGHLVLTYTNANNQTVVEKYARENQSGVNSGSYVYLGMEYANTDQFSEYGSCVSENFFEFYCYSPTTAAGSVGPVVQTFLDNGYLLTTVFEERSPQVILSRISVNGQNITVNNVVNSSFYNPALLEELKLQVGSKFNLYRYNSSDISDQANAECVSIESDMIRAQCVTANKAFYTELSTQLLDFDYIAPDATTKSQYFYSIRMPDKAAQIKLAYLSNKAFEFFS